jgi:hypothetical protein
MQPHLFTPMPSTLTPAALLGIRLRLIETPASPRRGRGNDHVYGIRRWRKMLLKRALRGYGLCPKADHWLPV